MTKIEKKSNEQPGIVITFWKVCAAVPPFIVFLKSVHLELEQRKAAAMVPKSGAEERGCVFTVKKTRICVHLQLQRNSSSTRVVNTRPWIFQISAWRRIFWEIFAMVAQCMEDKRPHIWHAAVSGYVKLQTSEDKCEGVCAANQRNENTREPRLPGLFEASHWWLHKSTDI